MFSKRFRRRLLPLIPPFLGLLAIGYFTYYTLQGDRGLYALKSLQVELDQGKQQLASLKAERAALETRDKALRPDSLDLDLLEERARVLLNYSRPNDAVIAPAPGAAAR